MRVDAHQHFWQFNLDDYGWISEEQGVIRRNFLPSDLKPVLLENKLDACVAVQARQSIEETNWLIGLAEEHSFIKGVVGWVDLKSEHLSETLEQYQNHDVLKGFRHVLQDESDPNFMLEPKFINGLKSLVAFDFCYDLLIFAHQLPESLKLVEQLPDLPIVIDHIAKPNIKDGIDFDDWRQNIERIAKFDNVMCKVSGMVTEADVSNWQQSDFSTYLEVVFEHFGPDRIMYGSDWPVCLLGGDYPAIRTIVSGFVAANYPEHELKVFGENAARFYKL